QISQSRRHPIISFGRNQRLAASRRARHTWRSSAQRLRGTFVKLPRPFLNGFAAWKTYLLSFPRPMWIRRALSAPTVACCNSRSDRSDERGAFAAQLLRTALMRFGPEATVRSKKSKCVPRPARQYKQIVASSAISFCGRGGLVAMANRADDKPF